MNFEDLNLNDLEFEEIGVWPLPIRILAIIVICLAVAGGGYYFLVHNKTTQLLTKQNEQKRLRDDFSIKYQQAQNIDAYRLQMVKIQNIYKSLLRQLPSEVRLPDLIEELSQLASAYNLEYRVIRPGDPRVEGFYSELPISLTMVGTYHDFGEYVNKIAQLSRIVTLHNFKLELPTSQNFQNLDMSDEEKANVLFMEVDARTYWYNQKETQDKEES